jgi:GNAT superfamily N-acetyltransferase
VARDAEGRMVAFVFTVDFAPDLLELANIFVVPEHQSKGLGTRLMDAAEEAATEAGFSWMMLVNSMLVPATYEKRAATDFYTRRGYSIILDSGPSKVFAKQL